VGVVEIAAIIDPIVEPIAMAMHRVLQQVSNATHLPHARKSDLSPPSMARRLQRTVARRFAQSRLARDQITKAQWHKVGSPNGLTPLTEILPNNQRAVSPKWAYEFRKRAILQRSIYAP
jgi:hypothetical protein